MALYFRISVLLPLLPGLLGIVIPGGLNYSILGFSALALIITLVPYLVFVICAWVWSYRRSGENYSYAMLGAPFVFGLFVFIDQIIDGVVGFEFVFMATVVSALYAWSALLVWHLLKLYHRKRKV